MAKKLENFDTDIDIDKDLDFDAFELPDFDIKDDRKPLLKAIDGLKGGIIAGARSPDFIRQIVKDTLPRGYGQSMDLQEKVVGSIRSIANESVAEMRPAIKELKRSATKLIPPDAKLVPKKVGDLLKRWKEDQDWEDKVEQSNAFSRDAQLSQQLIDIFSASTQLQQEKDAQTEGQERLRQGIEISRHRDNVEIAEGQARSLKAIDQYNRLVNLPVQKRTVELMHRQLFAQQDTLNYLRQADKQRDQLLANIMKNTGLPDFVKIGKRENLHQIVRNKFFDSANNGLFGDRNAIVEKFASDLREKIVGGAKGIASQLSMAASQAQMGADAAASGEGVGIDKWNMGGNMAGQTFIQGLLGHLAFKAKDKLQGSALDKKFNIIGRGQRAESFLNLLPQHINDFRRSGQWDFDDSLKGRAMRLAQTLTPDMQADMTLDRPTVRSMDDPMSFTKKTNRAITEIMPGLLSRILRSIEVLRTGDEKTELVEYDHIKGAFTKSSERKKNAFQSIFSPQSVQATQERLDSLKGLIDDKGELSEEARAHLSERLLMNSAKLRGATAKNLAQKENYTQQGASEEVAQEIAEHMKKFFASLDDEKNLIFSRMNKELITDVGETRGAVQQQLNLGASKELEELGLLKPGGRALQLDAVIKQYLDKRNAAGASVYDTGYSGQKTEEPSEATKAFIDLGQGVGQSAKNVWNKFSFKNTGAAIGQAAMSWSQADRLYAVAKTTGPEAQHAQEKLIEGYQNAKDKTQGVWLQLQQEPWFKEAIAGAQSTMQSWGNKFTPKTSAQSYAQTTTAGMPGDVQRVVPSNARNATAFNIDSLLKKTQKPIEESADEVGDIYVAGETEPRIREVLLKAGEYSDKVTGETITRVDDIKNDVVDQMGRIVLKVEELSLLRRFSRKAGQFIPFKIAAFLLNPVGWLAKKAWHYQTKIAPKIVAFNWRLVKATTKAAVGMLFKAKKAKDVYVTGEREPRLIGARMDAGYYFDKASGRVITNESEIQGAVVDKDGTVLIADDELDDLQVYNSIFKVFNPIKLIKRTIAKGTKALLELQAKFFKGAVASAKIFGKAFFKTMIGKPKDVYAKGNDKPLLYAAKMALGQYFSRITGKPIEHQKDIDGPVVDEKGNVVLSDEDIEAGLTDSFGLPVIARFNNKLKRAMRSVGKFFSIRQKLNVKTPKQKIAEDLTKDVKTISDKDKQSAERLKGKDQAGLSQATAKLGLPVGVKTDPEVEQVDLLKKIVNYFKKDDKRKAAAEKLGPDGVRKNSWQDTFLKKKKSAESTAEEKKKGKEGKEGGGFLKGIGKLLGGIGKKDEGGSTLGAIASLGRLIPGLGGLFGGAAAATGAAAAATSAAAAGTAAAGTAAAGTAAAAGAAGTAAAATGLGGAAATAGTAIATVAGGLLSFVTSPIVIAAAVAALVGYGVYKGYKYATRGSMSDIDKLRYVQYGFNLKNPNHAYKMFALEKVLSKYVKVDDGMPRIEEKTIPIEDLMEPFDLDKKKSSHVGIFFRWYQKRFKPVYLSHIGAINALKNKPDLSLASSLKGEELKKYCEATRFSSGPWGFKDLPMPDATEVASSAGDVEEIYAQTLKSISKDGEKEGDAKRNAADIEQEQKRKADEAKFNDRVADQDKKQSLAERVSAPASLAAQGAAKKTLMNQVLTPDAEAPPSASGGSGGGAGGAGDSSADAGTKQTPPLAGGALSDGRNASEALKGKPGVDIGNLHPAMRENLEKMASEYFDLTGKRIVLNDGFRSFKQQSLMKQKYGPRAAAPGSSLHEFGLAGDADTAMLDDLEKLGLMKKYGFTRPVGGEKWHFEPAGIQTNLDKFKQDPQAAHQAIMAGIGFGGGGNALNASARKYGRNAALAKSLLQTPGTPMEQKEDARMLASYTPSTDPRAASPAANDGAYKSANAAGTSTAASTYSSASSPDAEGSANAGSSVGSASANPRAPNEYSGLYKKKPTDRTTGPLQANSIDITQSVLAGTQSEGASNPEASGSFSDVPQVKGAGYANVKDTIEAAAKVVGYDAKRLTQVIAVESGFNPSIVAKGTNATGLGQFLPGTWRETVGKYGKRYGIGANTPASDGRANAIMTAHYLKDGEKIIQGSLGRAPNATDNYFAHFLGPYGAKKFLAALAQNPQTIGAELLPKAAAANASIFYNGKNPRTVAEIYTLIQDRINNKIKSFGINAGESVAFNPTAGAKNQNPEGSASLAAARQARTDPSASTAGVTSSSPPLGAAPGTPISSRSLGEGGPSRITALPTDPSAGGSIQDTIPSAPSLSDAQRMTRPTSNVVSIDAKSLEPTNRILSDQLDVQRAMAASLTELVGLAKEGKAGASTPTETKKATPEASPLELPQGRISSKRMV